MGLRSRLPDHHRDADSKDVVKLVMGLIGTMAALVLSLLIASAHVFYETQQNEVQQLSVDVVLLDRILARYGAETETARRVLMFDVGNVIRTISPIEGAGAELPNTPTAGQNDLFGEVQKLTPVNPGQSFDQSRALTLLTTLGTTRLSIHVQAGSRIPGALIVVLVIWLSMLFVGFGLFAKLNATVLIALFVGAVSVAGAIFLILEMSDPYTGLMQISSAPLRTALAQLGK